MTFVTFNKFHDYTRPWKQKQLAMPFPGYGHPVEILLFHFMLISAENNVNKILICFLCDIIFIYSWLISLS